MHSQKKRNSQDYQAVIEDVYNRKFKSGEAIS